QRKQDRLLRNRSRGGSGRGYGRSKLFQPRRPWSRGSCRTAAAKAGIQANDLIVGINGKPLYHINGIDDFLHENQSTPIQLNLKRNGADVTVPFEPGPLVVGEVSQDSPAARAGLRKGDVVFAIDQIPMKSTAAASEYIRHHGGQPVLFSVLRDGKKFELNITPEVPQGDQYPRIGISWEDNYGIVLETYGRLM